MYKKQNLLKKSFKLSSVFSMCMTCVMCFAPGEREHIKKIGLAYIRENAITDPSNVSLFINHVENIDIESLRIFCDFSNWFISHQNNAPVAHVLAAAAADDNNSDTSDSAESDQDQECIKSVVKFANVIDNLNNAQVEAVYAVLNRYSI